MIICKENEFQEVKLDKKGKNGVVALLLAIGLMGNRQVICADHNNEMVLISTSILLRPDTEADQTMLVPDLVTEADEDSLQKAIEYLNEK